MEASVHELVGRARDGDAKAFADLIRRYERSALAIAYAYIGDGDRAGDVVQDAFIRAWQRLSSLGEEGRFGPWLASIVRNLAIDQRRRNRHPSSELVAAATATDHSADPLQQLDRRETSARLADALGELDEISRSMVVLRYYEGLSSQEIGELLACSPASVDMRLSRARQTLRRLLAAEASSLSRRSQSAL